MGGMSKKRKYGSPGSKSIVNEEKEGELGQVEGDKRNTERTVRQDKDRTKTGTQQTAEVGILGDIEGGQVQG